ncbi:hypothetical protein [Rubritepida flocculans]|jgi:hypothetical protein|uniref:hypothetical protein n=1 Tax=Rubritepida flocculans TaxID=182403 RepID=UPI0006866D32|nr:hypothetical protein [Rubritepida flocculans]
MNTRRTVLTAFLALGGGPALAHGEGKRGVNGGIIGDVGDRHVEVLARDGEIRIWVLDAQDRPVPAAGASGSLIVLAQGRQQTIRLEPAENNAYLVARGEFRADRAMRVVATLTLPGQTQRQARFTPVE